MGGLSRIARASCSVECGPLGPAAPVALAGVNMRRPDGVDDQMRVVCCETRAKPYGHAQPYLYLTCAPTQ